MARWTLDVTPFSPICTSPSAQLPVVTDTPRWALETTLEAGNPGQPCPVCVFLDTWGFLVYCEHSCSVILCIEMPPPRRWFIPLHLPTVCFCEGAHFTSPELSPQGTRSISSSAFLVCFCVCVLSLFSVSNLTAAALSYYSLQKKQKPNRIQTSIWLLCVQFSNVCSSVAASGDPPADFCLEGSGTVVLCWDTAREVMVGNGPQEAHWAVGVLASEVPHFLVDYVFPLF